MSKNKNSNNNRSNGSRRNQRRPRRRNRGINNANSGALMAPVRGLSFHPTNPGRVSIRSAFEVFNTFGSSLLSYQGFNIWAGNVRSLLTPFQYFRVADVSVQARIAGGTSSPFSIIYNLSNSANVDASSVAILNDDYSAVATASVQPSLRPPRVYWNQGARKWYNAVDSTVDVSVIDLVAGTISFRGTGGTLTTDVVGWLIVEMDIEFHTLV